MDTGHTEIVDSLIKTRGGRLSYVHNVDKGHLRGKWFCVVFEQRRSFNIDGVRDRFYYTSLKCESTRFHSIKILQNIFYDHCLEISVTHVNKISYF